MQQQEKKTITNVPGILVGNYTDSENLTGCTVIRFQNDSASVAVDIRGSAPGTRETDLLDPINMIEKIHAIVLTGGSSYGLSASSGVMDYLEQQNIGMPVAQELIVPIVTSAVLFDLEVANGKVRPTPEQGAAACKNASNAPVISGNVGAGTGATIGKVLGMDKAMKSGLGTAFLELPKGVKVGAIFAVNAFGNVIDEVGRVLGGVRGEEKGTFCSAVKSILEQTAAPMFQGKNTTIGVVAINLKLNKAQLKKIAQMAHDGMARSINPIHTMYDGDTVFAASVPESESDQEIQIDVNMINLAGVAAAEVTAMAIRDAVLSAKSVPGLPAFTEWSV